PSGRNLGTARESDGPPPAPPPRRTSAAPPRRFSVGRGSRPPQGSRFARRSRLGRTRARTGAPEASPAHPQRRTRAQPPTARPPSNPPPERTTMSDVTPTQTVSLDHAAVLRSIPHRPPFLFI